MRNIYLLIILFLVACIICAEIYIYQVKSTSFFQASAISSALWLVELLLMLLVACFIGLAIGWQLRQASLSNMENKINTYEKEENYCAIKLQRAEEKASQIHSKLTRAQESFKEDFRTMSHEKQRLKDGLATLQTHVENVEQASRQHQDKLDFQKQESEQAIDNNLILRTELERAKTEIEILRSSVNKSFTLPPKDDLKLIVGIGPVIEKKLNGLGIYSFRQIGEFTPDKIDEITNAIKFFPGRIERDNWLTQARNFEEEKRRQAAG